MLRELADLTGLSSQVTGALADTYCGPWTHAPRELFADLAAGVADGADCVDGVGKLLGEPQGGSRRDLPKHMGPVVSEVFLRWEYVLGVVPIVNVYLARERARRGDRDEAMPLMRDAVDHLVRQGQLLMWGVPATGVLVQTLLDRGADGDVAEAEAAIERLEAAPADEDLVIRDISLLRLRALLARARGDGAGYREYRDHYRDMARTLGFKGHIEWAEAMP
jgi:hypothetical protein